MRDAAFAAWILCGSAWLLGCVGSGAARSPEQAVRATGAAVHEQLARAALRQGRYRDAENSAREALRVDPERPGAAVVLGQALLMQGDVRGAAAAAARAVALAPSSADAALLSAECAAAAGDEGAARDAYVRAADLGSTDAALALAVDRLARDDAEGAFEWLARAPANPSRDDADAALLLADHHWSRGRIDEAARILEEALARSPGDPDLERRYRLVRFARGDALQGAASDPLAGAHAVTIEERLLAAADRMRRGRPEEAAALYRELVETRPEDALLRVALGEALLQGGDAEGARLAFDGAVGLERSRAALAGLGRAYLALGRAADAVSALEDAVGQDPGHVPTRALLVLAYLEEGRVADAEREVERVGRAAPGSDLDRAARAALERARTGGIARAGGGS